MPLTPFFSYLSLGKGAGHVVSARVCFCSEPRGGVKENNNGELLKKMVRSDRAACLL